MIVCRGVLSIFLFVGNFRFALMEIKITMARLLKKYTIKECDKTLNPLPVTTASTQAPSEGVHVKIVSRNVGKMCSKPIV